MWKKVGLKLCLKWPPPAPPPSPQETHMVQGWAFVGQNIRGEALPRPTSKPSWRGCWAPRSERPSWRCTPEGTQRPWGSPQTSGPTCAQCVRGLRGSGALLRGHGRRESPPARLHVHREQIWAESPWLKTWGKVGWKSLVKLGFKPNPPPPMRWIRVPSHTNIPGNERADRLAEEGRISSPLFHVLSLPERPVISLELPSTPTPQRAPAVPHSLEMNDIITPSHDTPAFHRSTNQQIPPNDFETLPPTCLDFSHCISLQHSSSTDSSGDTASTVSFYDSDFAEDPEEVWASLGPVVLATPVQPRQRRRPNTPSTDVSSNPGHDTSLSILSGRRTPVTDSD